MFAEFHEVPISFVMPVPLSIHSYKPASHSMDFHDILYLELIKSVENSSLPNSKIIRHLTWRPI